MDTCFVTISHKYNKIFFNKFNDTRRMHGGIWNQNHSATVIAKVNLDGFLSSLAMISREHALEIDVSVNGIAQHIGHSLPKVYVALSFPFNRQLLHKIQGIRQSEFPDSEWHPDYRAYYIEADDAEKFITKSTSAALHEGIEVKSRIIGSFRDFEILFDRFDRFLIISLTIARHAIFGASFDSSSRLHRIPADDADNYINLVKSVSHQRGVGTEIVEIF